MYGQKVGVLGLCPAQPSFAKEKKIETQLFGEDFPNKLKTINENNVLSRVRNDIIQQICFAILEIIGQTDGQIYDIVYW